MQGVLASTEVYDPNTNTWTILAPMSYGRYYIESEVINGKIYAVGGDNKKQGLKIAEVYDPSTNTWTTLASMKTVRARFQSAAINGKLYVFGGNDGGYTSNSYTSSAEVYNPITNIWTTLPSMSEARISFQSVIINEKIYAIGGTASNGNLATAEVFTVADIDIPAPTSLTASGRDSNVDLSWSAVTEATSYNVYRALASGGPYIQIATGVTATTYTDADVTNGTTYYYVVTAVSSDSESAYSNEASATPNKQEPGDDESGNALLDIYMVDGTLKGI